MMTTLYTYRVLCYLHNPVTMFQRTPLVKSPS